MAEIKIQLPDYEELEISLNEIRDNDLVYFMVSKDGYCKHCVSVQKEDLKVLILEILS